MKKLLIGIFFFANILQAHSDRIFLGNLDTQIFASGINLAWGLDEEGNHNFAMDLLDLPEYTFPDALDELSTAGGNTLRWWLHTNGRNGLYFNDLGQVTGLDPRTIPNLKKVLDMARERGIVLSLCLWSFDMLEDQGQNQQHMKQLLEDSAITKTYIYNALIPIIEAVGNHPAILTWEIFNEPEGMTREFGWTPERTEMKYVQQFINLVAGAIHRHQPSALVSNGSWSFRASSDVGNNKNYYRDSLLIAAGGDSLGYLDFYQVHYFPEHFGNELSPFHNPASYWQLDKPIVIGEFPVTGINEKANPHKSTEEAYLYAFENGYAGCLSWSWTGFQGAGLEEAREGMINLWKNYPQDIVILPSPGFNFSPRLATSIPDVQVKLGENVLKAWVDLENVFYDEVDKYNLDFKIHSYTNPNLARVVITPQNQLDIIFFPRVTGKTTIGIKAEDSMGKSTVTYFNISVRDPKGNLALFSQTTASTVNNIKFVSNHATDGDMDTRWSSEFSDSQWIYVDLADTLAINRVRLAWSDAYASEYLLQLSEDATNWQTVYHHDNGDGGLEEIILDTMYSARYVRLFGITRGSYQGFSLFEFQVYFDNITSIAHNAASDFQVFPNPSSGIFYLTLPDNRLIDRVDVIDMRGLIVKNISGINQAKIPIDLSGHSEGFYLVKIYYRQQVAVRKIYLKY